MTIVNMLIFEIFIIIIETIIMLQSGASWKRVTISEVDS